ncbi:MAG: D-alanyl-D-alanine carboxypeptidase/D-alanyl-D-alanine-endopeptidase [Bacteroidota bacterium]
MKPKNLPRWISVSLLLFFTTCAPPTDTHLPQTPVKAQMIDQVMDISKLGQALQKLAKDPILRSGQISFSLKKVKSREVVMEHYSHKTLIPASCLKALTTATGLGVLGSDFQFSTRLEYSGEIKEQHLSGDLIIRGGGDPTLSSRIMKTHSLSTVLNRWTKKLKELGIKEIDGDILVDESAFFGDISPAHWIWGDMGNYFGAPAGAINVYDNTYRLYFQPGTIGKEAKIFRTDPTIEDIKFINEVKTAGPGTGDQASISGAPYDPVRYVSGTVPFVPSGGQFTIKGSIPDPALYLAQTWKQLLNSQGIKVGGKPTTSRLRQLAKQTIPWLLSNCFQV